MRASAPEGSEQRRQRFSWLTLLFLERIPLTAATFLLGVGGLALFSDSSTIAGPFEAERLFQVGLTSALAVLAGWHAVFMFALIWTGAHARFDLAAPAPPRWAREHGLAARVGGGVLVALPIILAVVAGPEGGAGVSAARIGSAMLGIGAALALCGLVAALAERIGVRGFLAGILRWAGPGYWDTESDAPVAGHARGAFAFFAFLAIYAGVFFGTGARFASAQYAAGIFALIVVMLGGSGLAGATFFLDRFRIPVLAATALVLVAFFFVWDRDHTFPVAAIGPIEGLDVDPREAAQRRLERQAAVAAETARPELLVVALAHGGGIQAAAWTTTVLGGLEAQLGPEGGRHFRASLGLLSSTSGGSVGLLHYLDRLAAGRSLDGLVEQASQSSLGAVLWGLLFPDLASILLPFTDADRGATLEAAWRATLPGAPDARLSSWGRQVAEGALPAVVFNATSVETGRPVWITPLAVPDEAGRRLGIEQLYDELPERHRVDLEMVTAARLSASFAYVSPAARPRALGGEAAVPGRRHVVDGGYFDNAGAVAAIEWLQLLTGDEPIRLPRRIALVELVAFPRAPDAGTAAGPGGRLKGLVAALFGPSETIFNARGASQEFRSRHEIELIRKLRAFAGVDVGHFVIRPGPMTRTPPLSWHLTPGDEARNANAWRELVAAPCSSVSRLARFVSAAPEQCPSR